MSIQKSEIKIDVNGKAVNAYLANGGGTGLLLLPSWWGLKLFFKQVADQFAEQGYTVLAADYYHGQVGVTLEETRELQQGVENDFESMNAMIQALKNHLLALHPNQPIGIVGFSMGTDWALITAAKESKVAATVLFYGGWSPDFSQMKSKVLGHYAETDEWVPLEQIRDMEHKLQTAGVDVTIHLYPKTAHWFVESDRPEYDSAAAQLAWDRTFEFLKKNLG